MALSLPPQEAAERQARLRVQVPLPCRASLGAKPERRAAQQAGNADLIAGPGAVAPQCRPVRRFAADHHVAGELRGARQIASRERHTRALGESPESPEEVIDPARLRPLRERQREQRRSAARRPSPRCRSNRAPARGGPPILPGCAARRKWTSSISMSVVMSQSVSGAGRPEHRAVVADPQNQGGGFDEWNPASE